MAKAGVRGINLWYELVGSGEVIAHIHGAAFGHQNFETITPLLSPHYQILEIDLRGYGKSDRPTSGYSMKPGVMTSRRCSTISVLSGFICTALRWARWWRSSSPSIMEIASTA